MLPRAADDSDLTTGDINWADAIDIGPAATSALVRAALGEPVPESIDQVLDGCGLLAITNATPAEVIHAGLVKVATRMPEWDPTRRALAVSVITQRLKAASRPNVAKIIKAAFPQDAPGSTPKPDKTSSAALMRPTEPWPEPVDGITVATSAVAVIRRYIVLSPDQAIAIALWVAHSYAIESFEHSPILAVLSPLKRCGKSTLLSVLSAMVDRALHTGNVTTAVLFRIIEGHRPTLLLDEADTWLNDDKAELRGIVNSGWMRSGAVVMRCEGDEHDPKTFSVWAPKVLSAIGRVPDTIADRSIIVSLRRKTRAEQVAALRSRTLEHETHELRRQLRRWADDHLDELGEAEPLIPEALNDRAADSWRPLLAIADVIGGTWPAQARAAALALSGPSDDESADETLPVQLLADLQGVFDDEDDPAVLDTITMLAKLAELPDRPWADFRHGKPLNAHNLARMLRPFGIVSAGKIRQGDKTVRGYRRDAFVEPWMRYVPVPPGSKVEQWNKPNESGPQQPNFKVEQTGACSTSRSGTNSMNTEHCSTVPLRSPEDGPSQDFLIFEEGP